VGGSGGKEKAPALNRAPEPTPGQAGELGVNQHTNNSARED